MSFLMGILVGLKFYLARSLNRCLTFAVKVMGFSKGDSTGRRYKFSHSALCLVHKIHWNFSALLHVHAKLYVHDCLYVGLTSMWTFFQLFWRHCFQIRGSFTQHWDGCQPKTSSRWNIYNSSTHVKFKYRDCPFLHHFPSAGFILLTN